MTVNDHIVQTFRLTCLSCRRAQKRRFNFHIPMSTSPSSSSRKQQADPDVITAVFFFFFLNIIFYEYVERNKEQHLAKTCVF